MSSEQEAELLDAIERVDRGEVLSAADLLSRLKTCPWPGGMSTSNVSAAPAARADAVSFTADALVVHLRDGRVITAPLTSSPRLHRATAEQRAKWELIGRGVGIHWTELDEDVSVSGLLGLPD